MNISEIRTSDPFTPIFRITGTPRLDLVEDLKKSWAETSTIQRKKFLAWVKEIETSDAGVTA